MRTGTALALSLALLGCADAPHTGSTGAEDLTPGGALRGGAQLLLTTSAVVPGAPMHFWAEGAVPGATITFAAGDGTGAGPCPPPLGGTCIDLVSPRVAATAVADAAGVAHATAPVPSNVQVGQDAAFQAFDVAGAASMKSQTVDATATTQTRFEVVVDNVTSAHRCVASGAFHEVVELGADGPAGPGQSYRFTVDAAPGDRLSLSSMFVQSNDFVIAPDELGIDLYDQAGVPLEGEIGAALALWDAGTEANEEPGVGPNQAPRQAGPDQGPDDPDDTVRVAPDTWGNLPLATDVVSLQSTWIGPHQFEITLANISAPGGLPTSQGPVDMPISPGAWCVHRADAPLFVVGLPSVLPGLEANAEDGAFGGLEADLAAETGADTPFAPVIWMAHRRPDPLFAAGSLDRGLGLESLAEDGDPSSLAGNLPGMVGLVRGGVADTPEGAGGPGPILPGDQLSFATMFVLSNDAFAAPDGGLDLFDLGGIPLSGDRTGEIALWDAGTEVNQPFGIGPDQPPFQEGPNVGEAEALPVAALVTPDLGQHLSVTVTALP